MSRADRAPLVVIVGGGLAGTEAAWSAANHGAQVLLYEMRPERQTPAHHTGYLAELVCSNSLKSALLSNASGLLKEEMRRLGSILLSTAELTSVPAGEALAVDPELFAAGVTDRISRRSDISVIREEVHEIPEHRPTVIATGPLTSKGLISSLQKLTGESALSFFDAVAPTVTLDSINMDRAFWASRRNRSLSNDSDEQCGAGDYLNCPLTKEEYEAFYAALVQAEQAMPHLPEEVNAPFFEACIPVEELARRGPHTLVFGPMRPVGLVDPHTGNRPYAVVQLRQENRLGTLWGLVGFQTRLRWEEQRRVFRMIPALEHAEFVRYGVMHRNTYIKSPAVLTAAMEMRRHLGLFVAGQLTGVEGYMESAATGILAGINAARCAYGLPSVVPPAETVIGSLCRHIAESDAAHFTPMNANYGLLPPLAERIRGRRARGEAYAARSLVAFENWVDREGLAERKKD
jgi:methylenetetrahydrofolate--tRNA-(uracil-5-)-methyltransferase